MNLLKIFSTSFLYFFAFRCGILGLSLILCKLLKLPLNDTKFIFEEMLLSIAFWFAYIYLYIWRVLKQNNLSDIEWYIVCTFIGVSLITWCYFDWDYKLKAVPHFGTNSIQMIKKKIIVFIFVMAFSFFYGYATLNNVAGVKEIDIVATITNVTIISGIIAFDRVLNQIMNLKNRVKGHNSKNE